MKKITILFMFLIVLFTLAACSGGEAEPEPIEVAPAVAATAPPVQPTATLLPPPVVSESGKEGEEETAVAAPDAPAEAVMAESLTLPLWPTSDFGYGVRHW